MNRVYVILSVFVTYISIAECNSTALLSGERVASYCYFCANCPLPFNPNSPSVSRVTSNSGWCTTMSLSSSPGRPSSRGVAQPGLCTRNGCRWAVISGVNTWVCCCDQYLCNGATPTTTTTVRPGTTCFFCSNCPRPFTRSSSAVSQAYSPTGWCVKMSTSDSIDAIYTRGAAQPGICNWSGCTWIVINEVNTWVCCCSRYLCNTGVLTSQSTIAVLSSAFMTIVVTFKSF